MIRKFELYQQVILAKDLAELGLKKGDAATIVEIIKNENQTGYCLEIFDSNGDTINVIIVNEPGIEKIKPHSIVNFRELLVQ